MPDRVVDGGNPTGAQLTKAQERAMTAFLWLARPEGFDTEASDSEVWDVPVRPWPTMGNLTKLGLIEAAEWLGSDDGWLWRLTDAGKAYMRTVVEARRG